LDYEDYEMWKREQKDLGDLVARDFEVVDFEDE
jgi:hypothetical protein